VKPPHSGRPCGSNYQYPVSRRSIIRRLDSLQMTEADPTTRHVKPLEMIPRKIIARHYQCAGDQAFRNGYADHLSRSRTMTVTVGCSSDRTLTEVRMGDLSDDRQGHRLRYSVIHLCNRKDFGDFLALLCHKIYDVYRLIHDSAGLGGNIFGTRLFI
jgi:hypothetical protein